MIPTVLLAGLVVGRWWSIPVLALLWVVLLYVGAAPETAADAAAGAALAAANAAVGVAAHRLAAAGISRFRHRREPGTH